ncbi:MAG: phosphopyruvate hydratase [Candidatus Parcubacteria bacterium]|nr:phosphopyruvate hydratase [Candidatus Parcubacteria bacterium]
MVKIKRISAIEILDSRDNPTVEVSCELENGILEKASVASGASTGIHEAYELRDNDEHRYNGLGVLKAVENVNTEINEFLQGKEFDQKTLDESLIKLDGTENKSRLGANAILGVSLAFARVSAKSQNVELYEYLGSLTGNIDFKLPQPMLNIINGGKHADSGLDIQEFMIAPAGFDSFHEKIQAGTEIISALRKILENKGFVISVGDEGGFAPKLSSNEEVFELLEEAIKNAGYSFDQIKIGIDVAASSFYKDGKYRLKILGKQIEKNSTEMIDWYEELIQKYPIIFIEDGLAQDDWDGFMELNKRLGDKIKIVGDDLTVTNVNRIKIAIEKNAINSVLIKLNQIGTLTETLEAIKLTKEQGWAPFISHRSGETEDTFIADLAVGTSSQAIKAGSLTKNERVVKYNRLVEIENILKK